MSLIKQRREEVEAKLTSLNVEFEYWKRLTTSRRFGRYHSQVRRLAATIGGGLAALQDKLAVLPPDSADVLEQGETWENSILAAHSIWEVFRSKLILRRDRLFANKLAACDDLAWECYKPALESWDPGRKGPPLVYLSATWSPFAISRDSNFQNEIRSSSGAAGALQTDRFQEVLQRLPIPLISIPWYQLSHLAGALTIAHEVGHVVETDFDLTGAIDVALKSKSLQHQDSWLGWAREMFADVYGCCANGPAFAGAMIDLNVSSLPKVRDDARTTGRYPTRHLRVRLLCETLRKTSHEAAADRLQKSWTAVYGEDMKLPLYHAELESVVDALLNGPYRGKKLNEVIYFKADDQTAAEGIAKTAGQFRSLQNSTDPRQLFAAARWLHENPKSTQDMNRALGLLLDQIVKKSKDTVRGKSVRRTTAEVVTEETELQKLEAADRVAGVALWQSLLTD